MKLAYVLELVVVLAVGFGVARWHIQDPNYAGVYSQKKWSLWLRDLGEGFVAGAAVAGCAGVWTERVLRRGPQPWAVGRWAWSLVGLYVVTRYASSFGTQAVRSYVRGQPLRVFLTSVPSDVRVNLPFWLLNAAPYLLIALVLTHAAGVPRGSASPPDAREWSGRVFAALIIVTGIGTVVGSAAGF